MKRGSGYMKPISHRNTIDNSEFKLKITSPLSSLDLSSMQNLLSNVGSMWLVTPREEEQEQKCTPQSRFEIKTQQIYEDSQLEELSLDVDWQTINNNEINFFHDNAFIGEVILPPFQ